MCPYHMCLQRPLDMEMREWIPISSLCESDLDHTVLYVTFDCVTRQRLDDYFFGMLLIAMDYLTLRDMTGRSVKPKLSDIRAKRRQSDNTSQSSACVQNPCWLWNFRAWMWVHDGVILWERLSVVLSLLELMREWKILNLMWSESLGHNKPFLFRGYTMLVLMELGCSVPTLQVGLVGRTDHFLLYV